MQTKFKQEINALTARSWEMELLISGFSLVFLSQSFDAFFYIVNWFNFYLADGEVQLFGRFLAVLVSFSGIALAVFFALNLVFRAYWVALIGLVQGLDKSYANLSFSRYRQQNIIQAKQFRRLDWHINKANKIASQLFGLALLVVCFSFSMILLLAELRLVNLLAAQFDAESLVVDILRVLTYAFLLFSLIYLFDLLSRGLLSRAKLRWVHQANFYIGRVMRIALGVALYEKVLLALHQTNGLAAALSGLVVSGLFTWAIATGQRSSQFDFANEVFNESGSRSYKIIFLDEHQQWGKLTDLALQQKVVQQQPIRLFLPLTETIFNSLIQHCPDSHAPQLNSACINDWGGFRINKQKIELDWQPVRNQHYNTLGLESFYFDAKLTTGKQTISAHFPFLKAPISAHFFILAQG